MGKVQKNSPTLLKTHHSFVKVRYAETDQMGVVHHGNYLKYFELARIEWLDNLGVSYKWMEKNGVILPVHKVELNYRKSAAFDDLLKVCVYLRKIPTVRIVFDYEIYHQEDLLTTGMTELIFVDAKSGKPIRCPNYILERL